MNTGYLDKRLPKNAVPLWGDCRRMNTGYLADFRTSVAPLFQTNNLITDLPLRIRAKLSCVNFFHEIIIANYYKIIMYFLPD